MSIDLSPLGYLVNESIYPSDKNRPGRIVVWEHEYTFPSGKKLILIGGYEVFNQSNRINAGVTATARGGSQGDHGIIIDHKDFKTEEDAKKWLEDMSSPRIKR